MNTLGKKIGVGIVEVRFITQPNDSISSSSGGSSASSTFAFLASPNRTKEAYFNLKQTGLK